MDLPCDETVTSQRCRAIEPAILYFGTPVVLLSTVDAAGRPNLTPMSSAWALGHTVVLGLADASQGCENLLQQREAVVNLPGAELWPAVEAIARMNRRAQVPAYKRALGYRHEADKFGCAGLVMRRSERVVPPRVADCPLQLEVRLLAAHRASATAREPSPGWTVLETEVVRVHAHERILVAGSDHIDTAHWQPLLYVFRHYFGTGARLGRNFRAET